MRAILLKIRRDEVSDGWVRGALCVADASPELPRPHLYYDREELREDQRSVRTWRTVSFVRYAEKLLPPGLYPVQMRWSTRFRCPRPWVILSGGEAEERRLILRKAEAEKDDTHFAVFWDELHAEEYETLKEQVLRRRIKNTLYCQCEVWLRVE